MGLPLLMLRNKQDEIRVFHNVCSHRGMILVNQPGKIQGTLRCPYHAWAYDFDGNLMRTPHIGGMGQGQHEVGGFNPAKSGLKPVRSAIWMGVIFINLSADAIEFAQTIQPLTDRWQTFLGNSGYARMNSPIEDGSLQIEVQSNWKLVVENYCEAYHLPWIHPDLNRYSKLDDHYHIMIKDNFAGQGSYAYQFAADTGTTPLIRFPEWPHDRIEQAEYVFVMIIEPIAVNRSLEHLRLFYVEDAATDAAYANSRKRTLAAWNGVFGEDVAVVEGMQKGRASPGYQGGVFSPVMDNPTHHFHQLEAARQG